MSSGETPCSTSVSFGGELDMMYLGRCRCRIAASSKFLGCHVGRMMCRTRRKALRSRSYAFCVLTCVDPRADSLLFPMCLRYLAGCCRKTRVNGGTPPYETRVLWKGITFWAELQVSYCINRVRGFTKNSGIEGWVENFWYEMVKKAYPLSFEVGDIQRLPARMRLVFLCLWNLQDNK